MKLITGKAHNFVTLLYIEQKDFLDSTKSNMDDFLAYHHIKNEI